MASGPASLTQLPRSNVSLPLGDINVVVVTDVHSWVAGHARHGEPFDADYGDVLSFFRRLQAHPTFVSENRDLFFVMNGDFVDGTGLSTVPPTYLTPILRQMPWDAVNIGNHELYHNGECDADEDVALSESTRLLLYLSTHVPGSHSSKRNDPVLAGKRLCQALVRRLPNIERAARVKWRADWRAVRSPPGQQLTRFSVRISLQLRVQLQNDDRGTRAGCGPARLVPESVGR